jgi:tetratricopeptide (TPR) repeat protein
MILPHGYTQDDEWRTLDAEAMSLYREGHYDRAIEVAKKALDVAEKAKNPNHPDVAVSLNNLAMLYTAQGQYAEAEPLYKRSLAIREKALGPNHPNVAASLENLAALYKATNRLTEAEDLQKRAAAIRAIIGRDESSKSPERKGLTREQMDLLWMDRTQLTSLKASALDPNTTVLTVTATGGLLNLKKSLKASDIEWAEKVMAIAEQATAASQRQDYAKAIQFYKQALEQAPECDLYLMSIGCCLSNMGKHREGLPYLERAAKINPNDARVRSNLAAVRRMLHG